MEQRARELVLNYYNKRHEIKIALIDVAVVWYCKTLKNWKAIVITLTPDNMLYEVTHNGVKNETYIDAYDKVENVVVPD